MLSIVCCVLLIYSVCGEELLLLTNTTVSLYDTASSQYKECDISNEGTVSTALDYNYEKGYLYYVTYTKPPYPYSILYKHSKLRRRKVDLLNCNDAEEWSLHLDEGLPIQQVVVDWVRDRIYWRQNWFLFRSDLDLKEKTRIYTRNEIIPAFPNMASDSYFENLLIDPYSEVLFMVASNRTDFLNPWEKGGDVPIYIITSDLSGENLKLYENPIPVNSTVELDIHNKMLYYSDKVTGEIGMYYYDKSGLTKSNLSISAWPRIDPKTLEVPSQKYNMFGVAGNNSYSLVGNKVYKVKLNATNKKELIYKLSIPEVKTVRLFESQRKTGNLPCNTQDCSFYNCLFNDTAELVKFDKPCQGANGTTLVTGTNTSLSFVDTGTDRTVTCRGLANLPLQSLDYHYERGYLYYIIHTADELVSTSSILRRHIPFNCREDPVLLISSHTLKLPKEIKVDFENITMNKDKNQSQVAMEWVNGNLYYVYPQNSELHNSSQTINTTGVLQTFPSLDSVLLEVANEIKKAAADFGSLQNKTTNEDKPNFHQVAVDWVNDNIYLLHHRGVVMGDLELQNSRHIINITKRHQKFLSASLKFQQLVVDPYNRMLILVATDYRPASLIITFDLSGNNMKLHENIIPIHNSIAVDVHNNRLYFIDKKTGEIGMIKYKENQFLKSALSISPWTVVYDPEKHKLFNADSSSIYTIEDKNVHRITWDSFGDLTKELLYSSKDTIEELKVFPRQSDVESFIQPSLKALLRKDCILPEYQHNSYSQYSCSTCKQMAGDTVSENQLIIVSCAPGTQMITGYNQFDTRAYTSCRNGDWEPNIPRCYKMCPLLTSMTLDLECWQGPSQVTCNQPMLPDTTVKFKCKQYYESSFYRRPDGINCLSSGVWSGQLPMCSPKCGHSSLNAEIRPQIVGGNLSAAGNFPWAAGLFHNTSGSWESKCGGTLISTTAVLTAAHCVTQEALKFKSPVMKARDVAIALGKLKRDWYISETSETKRYVKTIHVHPNYAGSPQNYGQDIAVLILDREVSVNRFVMPACVDYKNKYVSQLLSSPGGYIAGWGNTQECNSQGSVCDTPSDVLKYGETRIIDFNTCYNATQSLKGLTVSRLTADKFCAADGSESVVQKGDSGGGLTFPFDGLHYVYGVVSVKLKIQLDKNNFYSFGAFTSVPNYLDWLTSRLY